MKAEISFDGWTLRTDSRELLREGRHVDLSDQPLLILEALLAHPNQLVTREHLIAQLWPKGVVDFDTSLNTAMRKLRVTLGDDADKPIYIETVPRRGYRFIGKLNPDPSSTAAALPPKTSETLRMGVGRIQLRWWVAAIALIVVVGFVLTEWIATPRARPSSVEFGKIRIAVLPFENLSPDPLNAFFTDGMHEEVIGALVNRAPDLEVISRTTMMSYRATPKPMSELKKELGVSHVLAGSVRREGQDVKLTLQLIDARSDVHLWSKSYERRLENVMTLQSQVASEIASQLAVKLSADMELPPSTHPEAYDLYLKAHLYPQIFGGRIAMEELLKVESWLDRAISLDPAYAVVYIDRCRIRLRQFANSYDVSESNLTAVRSDMEMARKLAGDAPTVLMLEATYAQTVEWDLAKALRLLQMPQVLATKNPDVLFTRSSVLMSAHKLDEARALNERAIEADRGNTSLLTALASMLWLARKTNDPHYKTLAGDYQPPAYGSLMFAFTGRTDQLRSQVEHMGDAIDPGSRLLARFNLLRFEKRIAESLELLEQSDLKRMRQQTLSPFTIPAIGYKPLAELHGWTELLAGDEAAAARDGKALHEFLRQEPPTKWNAWFLRFLAAEAALFSGNKTQATNDARAALAMTPRNTFIEMERYGPATAAMIFAWAGAEDEAIQLLEKISTGFPGLGPAEITRDPLFSIPLAKNVRYQALEKKLEAEIAENQKLFE